MEMMKWMKKWEVILIVACVIAGVGLAYRAEINAFLDRVVWTGDGVSLKPAVVKVIEPEKAEKPMTDEGFQDARLQALEVRVQALEGRVVMATNVMEVKVGEMELALCGNYVTNVVLDKRGNLVILTKRLHMQR